MVILNFLKNPEFIEGFFDRLRTYGVNMWYVYILECAGEKYYTGYTAELGRRVKEHLSKQGADFVSRHLPAKLVFSEEHSDKKSAEKRERQIKGWSRKKKQALIENRISDLIKYSKSNK